MKIRFQNSRQLRAKIEIPKNNPSRFLFQNAGAKSR